MRIPRLATCTGMPLVLLALLVSPSLAQSRGPAPATAAPAAPLPEDAMPPATAAMKPRRPVNPVYPRIAAMLDAEKQQLAALRTRQAAAKDSETAMAIQREIEQVKVQTEVGILRLQAEHARKQGRTAVADGLDAAIRQMLAPPARATAAPRTAPAPDAAQTPSR